MIIVCCSLQRKSPPSQLCIYSRAPRDFEIELRLMSSSNHGNSNIEHENRAEDLLLENANAGENQECRARGCVFCSLGDNSGFMMCTRCFQEVARPDQRLCAHLIGQQHGTSQTSNDFDGLRDVLPDHSMLTDEISWALRLNLLLPLPGDVDLLGAVQGTRPT